VRRSARDPPDGGAGSPAGDPDETDSGLDIDALRIVANGVNRSAADNATIADALPAAGNYIVPDYVTCRQRRIVRSAGDWGELEAKGHWLLRSRHVIESYLKGFEAFRERRRLRPSGRARSGFGESPVRGARLPGHENEDCTSPRRPDRRAEFAP